MNNGIFQRLCVLLTSLSIVGLSAPAVSYAGIIDTAAVVESSQRSADLATVRTGLDRQDVRDRFLALGVDPQTVDSRLAALTDSELQGLAGRIEQLPAGGDGLLAVIGIVFVVLLVLELVGVIDIFKRT